MRANIIDGKAISNRIRETIKERVQNLKVNRGIVPGLTVILVGDDPASSVYVRNKERACEKVGIASRVIRLDSETTQEQLLECIKEQNDDSSIHGILVQLPLPKHIDEKLIIKSISPEKDVDGFHPINVGKLMIGEKAFRPCTPEGIIRLIKETGEEIAGKNAVVIGRSNIVGKPVAIMLLQHHATVTICHSRTHNLKDIAAKADILVVAMGKPGTIGADYIKEGSIVIDVGTTRVGDSLKGDVIWEKAVGKAGWITPVPGGVGPMTITMLLENTLQSAEKNG